MSNIEPGKIKKQISCSVSRISANKKDDGQTLTGRAEQMCITAQRGNEMRKIKSFKEALELSIEHWEWVIKTGKAKQLYPPVLFMFNFCFLCEWHIQAYGEDELDCRDCIVHKIWGNYRSPLACERPKSPYRIYAECTSPANARRVLNALKKALKRIEAEK